MNPPAPCRRAVVARSSSPRYVPAFTLIELLTVIAIVGILAAIILPVVGKVRQSALRSECASKLRHIGNAAALYAQDNQGHYPRAYTILGGAEVYWRELLARGGYLGSPDAGMSTPRPQSQWHGSHFNVLNCRAHRQTVPIVNPTDEWLRPTYSMNGTISSGQAASWRPRPSIFHNPARLAYVADGPPPSGATGVVINAAFWSGAWKPDASRAHNGIANILFLDGHVEARRNDEIPASGTGDADASLFWTGQ